jgi:site-specific DNA recombinase
MDMLKPLERERAQLAEGLRMREADRNAVALLPNAIDQYRAALIALAEGFADDAASRNAFRTLVDSVVVHPVVRRQRYDFSVYGRLAAILGEDVFPNGSGGGNRGGYNGAPAEAGAQDLAT